MAMTPEEQKAFDEAKSGVEESEKKLAVAQKEALVGKEEIAGIKLEREKDNVLSDEEFQKWNEVKDMDLTKKKEPKETPKVDDPKNIKDPQEPQGLTKDEVETMISSSTAKHVKKIDALEKGIQERDNKIRSQSIDSKIEKELINNKIRPEKIEQVKILLKTEAHTGFSIHTDREGELFIKRGTNPALNPEGHPMSLEEYIKDFLTANEDFILPKDAAGGTGSGSSSSKFINTGTKSSGPLGMIANGMKQKFGTR